MSLSFQITPEVVQIQLDHYNAEDIEGFMTVMSRDIKVFEFEKRAKDLKLEMD